jgi:hypothetical protein
MPSEIWLKPKYLRRQQEFNGASTMSAKLNDVGYFRQNNAVAFYVRLVSFLTSALRFLYLICCCESLVSRCILYSWFYVSSTCFSSSSHVLIHVFFLLCLYPRFLWRLPKLGVLYSTSFYQQCVFSVRLFPCRVSMFSSSSKRVFSVWLCSVGLLVIRV